MKTHKICKSCKVDLPIGKFSRNKRMSSGYTNFCKKCAYQKYNARNNGEKYDGTRHPRHYVNRNYNNSEYLRQLKAEVKSGKITLKNYQRLAKMYNENIRDGRTNKLTKLFARSDIKQIWREVDERIYNVFY